jgi:Protein of unknown function (DUF3999)
MKRPAVLAALRCCALLSLALASGAAAAQAPPTPAGFAYARTVAVPAAGWVRVPLDEAALRHAATAGHGVQVIGPEGEEVGGHVEPFLPPGERRPVRVLDVDEAPSGAGWVLLLDLGPSPPPHERLLFDFERRVAAPAVQLEGSADAQSWQPLASGDLFRLGGSEDLQRTTLAYPRTGLRYLRLTWPRDGGFPEVSRVEVETPAGPVLALPVARPDCQPLGKAGTVCQLRLPAAGLTVRRLVLEVTGAGVGGTSGALGYRLGQARDQIWWREVEGVRLGGGEDARTLHLTLGPAGINGDLLRLELFGGAGRPVLAAARIEAAVPTVLFRAAAPGAYTLAYGGVTAAGSPSTASAATADPAGADPTDLDNAGSLPAQAAWLEPGPERRLEPPGLPGAGSGEPLPAAGFRSSWWVRAPLAAGTAGTGDSAGARVVRLELPPEVYTRVRPDLGDLRLAVGPKGRERQIPYLRWTPLEPAEVALAASPAGTGPAAGSSRDLAARPVDRRDDPSWTSGLTLELPAAGLPLTQLLVTLPPGPFQRPTGLHARAPGPNRPDRPLFLVYDNQACTARPPLPCRAEFPVEGNIRAVGAAWLAAPARLAVTFLDGDDPPLAGLAVEAFRRRDVLVFAWPDEAAADEPVRLLAGAPDLTAPDYDLAALREGLLAQPWRPATLDPAGEIAAAGAGRSRRWLLLGTLALAAVALLFLLRRVLKEV